MTNEQLLGTAEAAQNPQTLWAAVRELRLRGQTDTLLRLLRDERLTLPESVAEESVRLGIRALRAELHLLMMQREKAVEDLFPYVTADNGGVIVDRVATAQLKEGNPDALSAGRLYTAIANTFYRFHQFKDGIDFSRRAGRWLKSADKDNFEVHLALQENELWGARLEAASPSPKHKALVQPHLETTLSQLTQAYERPEAKQDQGGRLDLLMSLAGNEYALLEWRQGDLDAARRRIYRALFLLRDGRVNDTVRLAHTLWTASRIEGSHSTKQFAWGAYLAGQAVNLFNEAKHIFTYRAQIQAVRCKLKGIGDRLDTETIGTLTADVDDIDRQIDSVGNESEQRLLRAEVALTRSWLAERRATDDQTAWSERLRQGQTILRIGPLPKRLLAEGHFQAGRAMVHQATQTEKAKGREEIKLAEKMAREEGHLKLEAACELALAESYCQSDIGIARGHWEAANRLLSASPPSATVSKSIYASKWLDRLRPLVAGPLVVDGIDDKTMKEADKVFKARYVRYLIAKLGSEEAARGTAGIDQKTMDTHLGRKKKKARTKRKKK